MKIKRRVLLINFGLQGTILLYTAGLAGSALGLNRLVPIVADSTATLDPVASYVIYLILILAYFIGAVSVGMVLTNRIAGPIYRIKNHMEAVVRGETPDELTFRKHDYFVELIEPYNHIIHMLHEKKPADLSANE